MERCGLERHCLGHYRIEATSKVVVYLHLFPWFPVIDVKLLFRGGYFVTLFHRKWDVFRDYDFALWWAFGCDDFEDSLWNLSDDELVEEELEDYAYRKMR